jgi:WD40 repeat protein
VALLLAATSMHVLAQQSSGGSAELVATLRGHSKNIRNIEFSPTGQLIAASSKDGTVRLWSTDSGESLTTIAGERNSEASELKWSSDDLRLAITYWRKKSWELVVWDILPRQAPVINQRFKSVHLMEWNPDGHTFLIVDNELNIEIWDVVSKQLTHTFTPALSSDNPFTVSFVADGQRILTAPADGPAQLWDVATGKLVDTYPANTYIRRANHPRRLFTPFSRGSGPIALSPDGRIVLTVREDAETKERHRQSYFSTRTIDNGALVASFQVPEGMYEIVWSPDGKTLAIVGLEFNTRLFDVTTGRENGRLPYGNCWPWTPFGSDGCEPIKFSADGEMLLKEKEPIKL